MGLPAVFSFSTSQLYDTVHTICTCVCVYVRMCFATVVVRFLDHPFPTHFAEIILVRRALQILNCLRFYARMCKQIYVPGLMICSATNAIFQSNDVDVLRTFAYSHSADRYCRL